MSQISNWLEIMQLRYCAYICCIIFVRGADEKSRSRRMHIYVSLLKQMAPEHLLATFAKLCAEILAAASDGMLNIEDATGQSVLQVLIFTSNGHHVFRTIVNTHTHMCW